MRWPHLVLLAALALSGCSWGDKDKARVLRVIDGDTIELADGRRVRYIGIDSPERDQPGYDSATACN